MSELRHVSSCHCVTPAEFDGDLIQLHVQSVVKFAIRSSQRVGQLFARLAPRIVDVNTGFARTQATDRVVIGVPACLAICWTLSIASNS
jgi:hypothetical protein